MQYPNIIWRHEMGGPVESTPLMAFVLPTAKALLRGCWTQHQINLVRYPEPVDCGQRCKKHDHKPNA